MASTDFTISDVLEWARTKPADETYNYHDIQGCAVYQFLKARGAPVHSAGGCGCWFDTDCHEHHIGIPTGVLCAHPATFGGLVERLEPHCPETPVTKSDWARLDAYMADIELAVS